MKILQLCKKFPFPLKDGESIAVTYLSKALVQQGCELVLLSMNTVKHYFNTEELPEDYSHYSEIHTVDIDNQVRPWDALLNLFSSKSYHISRFESDEFGHSLKKLLVENNFDLVLLETAFMATYLPVIRKYSDAKVVMRAHNVEHEIWERISSHTEFSLKKWYLGHLAEKLKRFELDKLNEYDFLVPISEADLRKFRKLGYANGAEAIPIGLDFEQYDPGIATNDGSLDMAFIGSLDWLPNYEGLQWFVQEIWPSIVEEFSGISLHVAGRNKPESARRIRGERIIIHGEVEDAREFLNKCPILVVPLRSGSGMRAKILEGMALGRIVITTTLGLEGIEAKHGEHVFVADDRDSFLDVLRICKEDPSLLQAMSQNAINFVRDRYDSLQLANKLKNALGDYLYQRSGEMKSEA